jgi:hypothetical protein
VAIGLELLADGARALWPQDIENATVHVDARGQGVFTTFVQASHAATSVKISSAFDNGTIVEISVSNPTTTTKLFDTYIGRLIDDMASELFEMVQDNTHAYTANCKELHLCLLLQRIEKLLQLASSNEVLVSRLEFLKTQVHNLRAGQQVNAGKIADSRFSSRFQIAGACVKLPAPAVIMHIATEEKKTLAGTSHRETVKALFPRKHKQAAQRSATSCDVQCVQPSHASI